MQQEKHKAKNPQLPWKSRFLFAAHCFATSTASRSNHTVNRTLMKFLDPKISASSKPTNQVSSFDIPFDPSNHQLWFRLFTPTTTASAFALPLPLVVYFHGGGFCFNSANSLPFDQLCRRFARELPAVVVCVNYRLAPEFKCPCQYEDGFSALKFIDGFNFNDFNVRVDLHRCFVAGDSAGGNLGHHVVVKASDYKFHNLEIIGLIAIQPFFGGEERTEVEVKLVGMPVLTVERTDWLWKAFLPEGSNRDHPVVNVFGPNGVDISGVKFPSVLLFVGGFDILQDWHWRYYEWLKKAGKEVKLVAYPNAVHAFYAMDELPESSLMIDEIRSFVEKQSDRI